MDFIDQLKQFSNRVTSLQETIQTEEATKTAIIMPFLAMLGYDVFNPHEVVPEFTADVGIKKGEKVDYAILKDGEPVILIECKSIAENLDQHGSQLFRYFGTTSAKFAILTNGLTYRFYTDLDDQNKMDKDPFLSINILDIQENQVPELKKFCKTEFNVDSIFSTASELKYANEFKRIFAAQLDNPSDDFLLFFLHDCYAGKKTQNVLEKFRPVLKRALNTFISEMMNNKIKAALGTATAEEKAVDTPEEDADIIEEKRGPKIETTEAELEAYFIVKNMLADVVDIHDITYKDTASYFNVLYRGNTRKWICRLKLGDNSKTLILPDENKKELAFPISDIYDLNNYKDQLEEVLKRYL